MEEVAIELESRAIAGDISVRVQAGEQHAAVALPRAGCCSPRAGERTRLVGAALRGRLKAGQGLESLLGDVADLVRADRCRTGGSSGSRSSCGTTETALRPTRDRIGIGGLEADVAPGKRAVAERALHRRFGKADARLLEDVGDELAFLERLGRRLRVELDSLIDGRVELRELGRRMSSTIAPRSGPRSSNGLGWQGKLVRFRGEGLRHRDAEGQREQESERGPAEEHVGGGQRNADRASIASDGAADKGGCGERDRTHGATRKGAIRRACAIFAVTNRPVRASVTRRRRTPAETISGRGVTRRVPDQHPATHFARRRTPSSCPTAPGRPDAP